jgi:HTH-type transcriptional regulator / antitoxin HipB
MRISTPEQLGSVIRLRRRQLTISQGELALTCGTGTRFIVDLERGKPTCQIGKTLDVLRSLGLLLDVTPLGHGDRTS